MYGIKKITEIMDILLNNNSLLTNSKRSFYFLLEPIVGTAMMTSLSLICNKKNPNSKDYRFKESILKKMRVYEENLILHNNQFGIMQAYIRNKGEIPPECLVLFEENHPNEFLKLKSIELDEHVKILTVKTINKNGEENIMKSMIPSHPDLSTFDSFELELFKK
jgi:hypothetical protein